MARAAALALACGLAALLPASAWAGWSRPFELVKPGALDYLPTQLAFSSQDTAAAAFAIGDVDTPGTAQAYVVSRSAAGAVSNPVMVPGAQEVLALGFHGPALELVLGTSPAGLDCCSSAEAIRFDGGAFAAHPQALVGGLTGATLGQLVTLADGRMLAAVATERGVWAMQSARNGGFGGARRLSGDGQAPESLSASWLGGESSLVVWTAGSGSAVAAAPRSIFFSLGSRQSGPRRAHTLLSVPTGHRIDELAVARRGTGATAAWVESWYDQRGAYHSQVKAADFGARPGIRTLSSAGELAAGISLAADGAGAQAVAWPGCSPDGGCTVRVATRSPSASFDAPVSLGAVDASQHPSVAVGPRGQALVGWVSAGHPMATVGSAADGRFGAGRVLSSSLYALDETVAFGPRSDALAAWTQGTLNPSVVAAAYRGP